MRFLFPLLLSRKEYPRDLLLDIKMTQSCNDRGESAIIQIFYGGDIRNSSPFTKMTPSDSSRTLRSRRGKNASKLRRLKSYRTSWGSVDILNELREFKHRPIRYRILPTIYAYDGLFIDMSVDSEHSTTKNAKLEKEQINNFLEYSLSPGNRLSWGGDPDRLFQPILITYY
jgi:hypothetical protein